MKLASLRGANCSEIGIIGDNGFLPIANLIENAPLDMIEMITRWGEIGETIMQAAIEAASHEWRVYAREDLLAPVQRPGKILAIGLNYVDHITETGFTPPEHQLWFSKQSGSANGPYADVHLPRMSAQTDYEVEMVAIIGKAGRHISEEDAPAHVFGYCVGNDVSARDWQMRTSQWVLGKSFDTHAPFGPWITTADAVADPHMLDITCWVNGEVRQRAQTSDLCFNIWQQIAHLSQVMTLEPGDVIFTGTPAGVGLGMVPPRYLNAGDVVRCEVELLGTLENRFVTEP